MNRFALQRLPVLVLNTDSAPSRLQAIDPAIQDSGSREAFATTSLAASVAADHPNNRVLRIELAKLPNSRLNGKEYH